MASQEQYAVDYMTHGLLSISLLEILTKAVYSSDRESMTIGQFYDRFQQTHQSLRFRPFNEGVLLAYMYLAVLFAHENWKNLVPDVDLSTWNIAPKTLLVPKKPNPRLRYVVRRMRNSLGHGSPRIHVPTGVTQDNMASVVTVAFHDVNTRNASDTFDMELSLGDALEVAKMLHKIITDDAANRYNVSPPGKT